MRKLKYIFVCLLLFSLFGCALFDTDKDTEKKELFELKYYSLEVGGTLELDPIYDIPKEDVEYVIENRTIISIEKGIVTALSEGETTVVASYEDRTSTLTFKTKRVTKEFKLFDKESYNIMVTDTLLLVPNNGISNIDITYRVEDNRIISIQDGLIKALNVGETVVHASAREGNCTLKVKVTPYVITVKDAVANVVTYNKLKEKINQYETMMNECNAIQMQNYTIVQNASAVQLVNINREHNYVEMYDNSSNQIQIVKEIDNKVFQFSSYEYDFNQFTLEYLGVVEDYDFEFNMDNVLHCSFSTTGGNIYNNGDVFVIEAYFKDFLDYNSKNSLYELYLSLGLNSDTLLKSPIYVIYIFEDNSVTISISANIYLEVKNSSIYQIFLESTSTYLLEEFEMFDENDSQYTVQAPSSYEEILHETDILKDGIALENYVRDDGMYLKCYLEHGQYYLIEPHSAFTSVGLMEIFDEDMNLVNHYPQELYKKYGSSYLRQAFYIPEDGYYYMRLNSDPAGYEHRYNVVKVDYETSPFDLIEDTPDEMTGNIEGFGDVDFYTYTNTTNENKVIRITNNADSNVCVIARRYDENYMTNDIPANSSAYFLVTPGENKFYITHEYVRFDDDDVISKIPYSYDMSITEMNYNYGVGADGNDLEYVTTEFNEDYLMVGYGFPSSYMLLEVNEHGYYTFVEDFVDENMYYCQVVLYDSNGNRVMNDGSLRFKLNPGVYTVAIVNNEHVIDILRIKYEFQPIAN